MEKTQLLHLLAPILTLIIFIILKTFTSFADEDNEWLKHLANKELNKSYVQDAQEIRDRSYNELKKKLSENIYRNDSIKKRTENLTNIDKLKNYDKYVFVSSSIPKKNLINLAKEAKKHNTYLVIRGLIENSYPKTTAYLQDIIEQSGSGFLIDPELFRLYHIETVPAFIVSRKMDLSGSQSIENCQIPQYDQLVGNVSLNYALDQITKYGDLADE